jgi:hypothetical protein
VDVNIRRICAAHPGREDVTVTPRFTVVDGAWALCEGNGPPPHEWVAIPPTHPQFAGDAVPAETRHRWWRRWWERVRDSDASTGEGPHTDQ